MFHGYWDMSYLNLFNLIELFRFNSIYICICVIFYNIMDTITINHNYVGIIKYIILVTAI